jgi:hypothetical protein
MEELVSRDRGGALLLLLLATASGTANAGCLRKVWDLSVETAAQPGEHPVSSPHVYAVSFSPDGRRVAAVVGKSMDQESLVLVDKANPGTDGARYELHPPSGGEPELSILGYGISWSLSGEAIALGSIVQTSDGRTCPLPRHKFFFFGADHVAGLDPTSIQHSARNVPWHLLFFNAECQDAGTWEIPYEWYISDASADRGLLCLLLISPPGARPGQPETLEVLVASPSDRTFVHRWRIPAVNLGLLFADSGKVLCGLAGTAKHGSARCWSVDTGKEVAATKGLNIHQPMRTALHAQRAVLSHYGWGIDFEDFRTKTGALKRRVIWDFGTGRELASWKPKWQRFRSADELEEPYKFAISPDGNYVLEGGDGVLTLYKIEP